MAARPVGGLMRLLVPSCLQRVLAGFLAAALLFAAAAFSKWAMLDSNQRPPPCKLGRGFPGGFGFVEESRLSMGLSLFIAYPLFYYVRVCPAPVAVHPGLFGGTV